MSDFERSTDNQKKSRQSFDQRLFELYRWKFQSDVVMRLGLRARHVQHAHVYYHIFNMSR